MTNHKRKTDKSIFIVMLMEELLKTYLLADACITAFSGLIVVGLAVGIVKSTKSMENRKGKTALRIILCGALAGLWTYFFAYQRLYPISVAYYEYQNHLTAETVGIIESIDHAEKDCLYLCIDGTNYKMAYSSTKPVNGVGTDILEGDAVHIQFGEQSMYIFDIREMDSMSKSSIQIGVDSQNVPPPGFPGGGNLYPGFAADK